MRVFGKLCHLSAEQIIGLSHLCQLLKGWRRRRFSTLNIFLIKKTKTSDTYCLKCIHLVCNCTKNNSNSKQTCNCRPILCTQLDPWILSCTIRSFECSNEAFMHPRHTFSPVDGCLISLWMFLWFCWFFLLYQKLRAVVASNKDFSRYFRAQSNYFTITHYAGNVSDA